jgi:hypothetical protein
VHDLETFAVLDLISSTLLTYAVAARIALIFKYLEKAKKITTRIWLGYFV